MYVCICNQATDSQVKNAINTGCISLKSLCKNLNLGTQCGRCCYLAKNILKEITSNQKNNSQK